MGRLCVCILFPLLVACSFGPEYTRNYETISLAETYFPERVVDSTDGFLIEDPLVEEWLRTAARSNQSLLAAAKRIEAAQARVTQSGAAQYPTLAVEGNATRSRQNLASFGGLEDVVAPGDGERRESLAIYNSLYTARLASSWQLDVFGRIRKAENAAEAEMLATDMDREALEQTIAAQLLQLRSAFYRTALRIASLRTILDLRKKNMAVIEGRYRSGLDPVNALAVHQAREAVSSAKADWIRARQAQLSLLENLNVLLGRPPLSESKEEQERRIASYSRPLKLPGIDALPLAQPAEIIDTRPDLRAAELRVLAATERVGVRIADLYPQLSLSGGFGYQANESRDLIQPQHIVWQIAGALTQTIVSGGSRWAAVSQSEAEMEALQAEYLNSILIALQEIKVALDREQSLRAERRLRRRSERQLALAADSVGKRYQRGVVPADEYLEAERLATTAELSALNAAEEYEQNIIDLYVALGGPWIAKEE